jgi:hypothetical protein
MGSPPYSIGGGILEADAFVTRVNPAGSVLFFSTYLGGSSRDYANGIVVDPFDNAYLVVGTDSANFPTVNPLQPSPGGGFDAFGAQLNGAGSRLVYSSREPSSARACWWVQCLRG